MTISTIGVPMDLGADRRGVDMGPSAIRYAGLASTLGNIGRSCVDAGDLTVPHAEERDPEARSIEANAKYLDEVESVCTRLADEVASSLDDGALPLVLGGDHSIAIGTLVGASRDAEIGAIWFDAHSDVNTPETTPSGNVHGMPLAAALGMGTFADTPWANAPGLREENVVLVGLRSVDEPERERIRDSAITAYTMSDIDQRGVVDVTEEALDIATDGVDGIHVSLDLDWLDPSHAPGVGTPVRGGVTYREAHSALETVADRDADTGVLRSLELVEANPILDSHNETAELGVELVASALGKRVL
ncbi:arginase [Halococcus saccharolyticus]|uniref:Arginase n=1 Tax=Halococcus saccharolyticus DSM 5350 TaxID=1227455 RepID=M0MPW2_9EURY|nr:arginase [Halococcus saccharolyticus]EMA46774.1 arginase [Halococcus saccharolyticus DSM 5350]